ncbi:GDSL-type esterase/lipase family protein [Oscillospiraceae bacterium 44-5]
MARYQGKRVARSYRAVILFIAAAAAVALAVAGVVRLVYGGQVPPPPDVSQRETDSSADRSSEPASQLDSAPKAPPYDFSQPAPASEAVDNRYFDDAAFVGDSRTDGFMLYSGVGTGKNLTSNGLSIFTLSEKKVFTVEGETYTLLEALALEEYGKVYLSLGVNELGIYKDKSFYSSYSAAIDQIRLVQPGAVIYIQGLIPVNEAQVEEHNGNKYNLSNDHLRVYNDLMRQVAEEKQVVYLDLYSEFADENGSLPEGLSRDGVHLTKEPCQRWLEYLKTHTVDFDALYPDGPPVVELPEPEGPEISTADGSEPG